MSNCHRLQIKTRIKAVLKNTKELYERKDIVDQIETSCYNAAIQISKSSDDLIPRRWDNMQFVDIYSMCCFNVICLLDANSIANNLHEPYLLNQLKSKKIDPSEVGQLSIVELCPSAFVDSFNELEIQNEQMVVEKLSTTVECPRCHKFKVKTRTVQTRSADEGSTNKYECVACGHRWSSNN